MALGKAIGWSIAVHVGFLLSQPPEGWVPPSKALYPIEVIYRFEQPHKPVQAVSRKEVPGRQVTTASPKPAPPRAVSSSAPRSSAASDRPESVELKPSSASPAPRPASPTPRPAWPAPKSAASPSGSTIVSGMASLPEEEFASIQYKQQVRSHLKRALRYPALSEKLQGIVRLRLVLQASGALKEAIVLEASDPRLARAALEDTRAGEPFPRFPKKWKAFQAEYEFLVQYLLE